MPHRFKADWQRLSDFIAMLDRRWAYAFEFRDESWYGAEIIDLLRANDIALCISDHADAPAPWLRTGAFVYVRGHGPSGRYHGNYSDDALQEWAADVRRWRREGHDVWCFFDNDVKSAAPADAARLRDILAASRQRKRTSEISR